ncbi:MAG: Carbohydrate-selective porin [Labilithrix sp.]|nr:Carbohydrate-selective porin [Labilithrix sp.]
MTLPGGRRCSRAVAVGVAARVLLAATTARAQAAPSAAHDDQAVDVMNLLADHGLHDLDDESWNAYGQLTYISSWKLPFHAPYTNKNGSTNSLLPGAERSFTASFTLFFGLRLWRGGEAYFVPEVISERPLSQLRGLGGSIQNFELQKTGGETPQLYRARTFLRQTFGLGGTHVAKTSDPMQLGSTVDSRRVVLTAGNFTILDVFDRNSVTWDPRQTFFNMAFMTHSSWDFPSDARGYSWGGTAELYWDDWAFRIGRITPPQNPNQLQIDFRIDKHYGDQFELEHDHTLGGRAGAVRLLAYRNRVVSGRFDDAIAAVRSDPTKNAAACTGYNYGSANTTAPDLCWVRKPTVKVGIGISLEQHVIADDIGVFFRGMFSDGRSEVDAFNPADRSMTIGASAKGSTWHRPLDVAGVGYGMAWISGIHGDYLRMGGVDGFVGDGDLKQAPETVLEAFYSVSLLRALWLSADYQHIENPGFNADRGPVNVFGARVHAEF